MQLDKNFIESIISGKSWMLNILKKGEHVNDKISYSITSTENSNFTFLEMIKDLIENKKYRHYWKNFFMYFYDMFTILCSIILNNSWSILAL